jgi:hypothetical protein
VTVGTKLEQALTMKDHRDRLLQGHSRTRTMTGRRIKGQVKEKQGQAENMKKG